MLGCFSQKTTNKTPKEVPPGLNSDKLFPKYEVHKYENSSKKTLKGTNIIISRKKLKNEYYTYSKKYPWIKITSFNLQFL